MVAAKVVLLGVLDVQTHLHVIYVRSDSITHSRITIASHQLIAIAVVWFATKQMDMGLAVHVSMDITYTEMAVINVRLSVRTAHHIWFASLVCRATTYFILTAILALQNV